jgi:O-antigen biosynthesis protein WbqP
VIRFFDIFFSFFGLLLLSPILLAIIIFGFFDTGSPIFFQERMGKGKKPFLLLKFRSMHLSTPSVATHLASASSLTTFGALIRKFKLDELPQLFNVFFGDMSLVGPRPNLFNQQDLILERESRGVYFVRPGITGLAQIKKIDMSSPRLLAKTDARMIQNFNTLSYFKYIFLTILGRGFGDRITRS